MQISRNIVNGPKSNNYVLVGITIGVSSPIVILILMKDIIIQLE